jgi:valyl-tRNA synthetase
MPFITEELWQRISVNAKDRPPSIALATFPQPSTAAADEDAESRIDILQEVVTALRNLRAELKLDPKQTVNATLYSTGLAAEVAGQQREVVEKLAMVQLAVSGGAPPAGDGVTHSASGFDVRIEVPAAQLEERRKRIEKELAQLERNIANSERQLSDPVFLGRAPEKVVQDIRSKLANYKAQHEKLSAALAGD